MNRPNECHVIPSGGGWQVKRPGAPRASATVGTQREGVARAREILRAEGGGEVVIHQPGGAIRQADAQSGQDVSRMGAQPAID